MPSHAATGSELRGFGAFSVRKRDARKGRNPRPANRSGAAKASLLQGRQGIGAPAVKWAKIPKPIG